MIEQNKKAEKGKMKRHTELLTRLVFFSVLFRFFFLLCIIIPLLAGIFEVIQALVSAFQTRRFLL